MRSRFFLLAGSLLLGCLGGCATVSVYEPATTTEISLAGPSSELQRAARAYCETARTQGLAAGEASLKTLSDTMFRGAGAPKPYWSRVEVETAEPARVLRTLRSDAAELTAGLLSLNTQAAMLLRAAKPTKDDVAEFERVLIHARQGRESLAAAVGRLAPRVDAGLTPAEELLDLDRAVARAQELADDLSAARTSESLTSGPVVVAVSALRG